MSDAHSNASDLDCGDSYDVGDEGPVPEVSEEERERLEGEATAAWLRALGGPDG